MIKDLKLTDNILEGTVRSEMYRETTIVINVSDFYEGKNIFPCGDGCDYSLTYQEDNMIQDFLSKKKTKDVFARIKKTVGK